MWKLDHEKGWAQSSVLIDAFELWYWRRFLRGPWTSRRSNQSILSNQPWIFIGRADAEVEAPILWLSDAKSQLIGEDPDAGRDWRQETESTEDEMVGWHHRLNGHKSEETLADSEGQGSLACCSPWDCKELDRTEWPNNIKVLSHGSSGYFLNRYISVIFYCLV